MKRMIVALAVLLAAGVVSSWAGGACCPAGGKAKAEKQVSACTSALSGVELTDDQKAKIATIEAACKEAGSTVDACAKSKDEIRSVLTEEQRAKFDAKMDKKAGKKDASCG
ncbi:MAG TPA: hypothetical protein PKE12_00025 [Kiritimatiellia bacterium]|nr:hypothetical protein [Kiritimatiellia bacterium]